MYLEHREEVIVCIWNTVRFSSYVSGIQGGLLMYQEHREEVILCIWNTVRCSYVSEAQGGGLIYRGHIEEVLFIRDTLRRSLI